MAIVNTTKAPNLVLSERDYKIDNETQFRNQLRIYFNQVDTLSEQLLVAVGGANLDFPHIAAYYDADQEATADDTATKILWNTSPDSSGFTFNTDNSATCNYDGTYKIEYRLQAVNTDNTEHNMTVWMQIDGTDLAYSATEFTLAARKSNSAHTHSACTSFITWEATAGQKVTMMWATEQAYDSGVSDGIYLEATAAQTTPYVRPAIPSSYGVIQYIGRE